MLGASSNRTRERLTVSVASETTLPDDSTKNPGILGLLLAMAMFVLVVDTSLMNVSISAVVKDLNTTASGVQSAIAIEALVSAAFILISSKVADLIGRRLGYVLGLLGYAVGALAMVLSQSLLPIVIFWAVFGGLGASLLLPSMQALIHGNFQGVAQKKVYALVGASSAIAAAIGPLIGGFVTTFLSWRVGFLLELVVIAVVLSGIRLVKDVPYTGDRRIDVVGGVFSVLGMGGIVLGILAWEGGGGPVLLLMVIGAVGFASFAWWIVRRKRRGDPPLIDPDLFKSIQFRLGISGQTLQQIALGGSMIALPIFLQMVLEYNALQAGLSLMPLSLSMFAVAVLVGRRSGSLRRRSATIIQIGFGLTALGALSIIPVRAAHRFRTVARAITDPDGHRPGPARIPTQQLHARADLRGAHQRGCRREFGRRLVWAVVRPRAWRSTHAGRACLPVHEPGQPEHRAIRRAEAGSCDRPERERRGDEQHPSRRDDRQSDSGG